MGHLFHSYVDRGKCGQSSKLNQSARDWSNSVPALSAKQPADHITSRGKWGKPCKSIYPEGNFQSILMWTLHLCRSLSLSLHTACIHVYQILYILITKKLPTHISIRIHIYIIYILYMIDGTVNGQEARTQQITVDTENPPFVDHFPCRCVCHIYGNSIMAIYWTAKAHHVKDSLRCLRESSSQHKICHLLIKPCPHACFLRGIAFVNWSDPFSRLQAICGINGDTRGIPQMHGS